MPSMLERMASASKSRRHGAAKSPFENRDEPTPRVVPPDADDASRQSLREEAARGAGTPGYMTKQPQDRVSSALDPHTSQQQQQQQQQQDSESAAAGPAGSSSSSSSGSPWFG